jgi:hypothetical protein
MLVTIGGAIAVAVYWVGHGLIDWCSIADCGSDVCFDTVSTAILRLTQVLCEADYPPQARSEVQNAWRKTCTDVWRYMTLCVHKMKMRSATKAETAGVPEAECPVQTCRNSPMPLLLHTSYSTESTGTTLPFLLLWICLTSLTIPSSHRWYGLKGCHRTDAMYGLSYAVHKILKSYYDILLVCQLNIASLDY